MRPLKDRDEAETINPTTTEIGSQLLYDILSCGLYEDAHWRSINNVEKANLLKGVDWKIVFDSCLKDELFLSTLNRITKNLFSYYDEDEDEVSFHEAG